ncbi:MAG TPA: GPW/gp25 family protein [Allosphingosinicella sp.]
MTQFGFPYRIDANGETAGADHERHIRDMIEQLLFTRRGERVNRPDFGAGANELVFSENAPELAAAAQHMVMAALQQWLSDAIEVRGVETAALDSRLSITVRYRPLEEAREQLVTVEQVF